MRPLRAASAAIPLNLARAGTASAGAGSLGPSTSSAGRPADPA